MPVRAGAEFLAWPQLPELFPFFSPGIITARDEALVDVDRHRLEQRIVKYFDPTASLDEIRRVAPVLARRTSRFPADDARIKLLARGYRPELVTRYLYRPFDVRWLYWEQETKLIEEKRSEFLPHVFAGNVWLSASQRHRREQSPPLVSSHIGSFHLFERAVSFFPLYVAPRSDSQTLFQSDNDRSPRPNLTDRASAYLAEIGAEAQDLFHHVVAILHAPDYGVENAGALRQDWPRVPLPADRPHLLAGAALGRDLATLLDPESPTQGVTAGEIRRELRVLGVASRTGGGDLTAAELALSAGWGHSGKGGAVMPGRGRSVEREYGEEERVAIRDGALELGLSPDQVFALLGERTVDVYLNERAYWCNVPVRVWEYTLGGYQVIKKWLSYREEKLLGRPLHLDEVREVTSMVRRIAAILLLEPALDAHYAGVKQAPIAFPTPNKAR